MLPPGDVCRDVLLRLRADLIREDDPVQHATPHRSLPDFGAGSSWIFNWGLAQIIGFAMMMQEIMETGRE